MISFASTTVSSTFLDPNDEWRTRSIELEHRSDPLTGRNARIAHYIPPRERMEIADVVKDSAIPIFAPPLVEQVTPQFPPELVPEGRLRRGRSVLFPNLNPYDEFSPVVAIGDQPLVLPGDLSPDDVGDALCLLRDFFATLPADRRVGLVGWNYLPQSSSSIPHPHMQAAATARVPDRPAEEYAAERRYRADHGADFWDDLVSTEREGPRWLGDGGGWSALIWFASQSPIPESVIVADDAPHLGAASDSDLWGLADHIVRLASAYDRLGYSSFNVVLHPTASVDGSRLRARYVPRSFIVPKLSSSDWSWVHIGTGEGLCMINPEAFAEDVRAVLG